MSQYRISPRMSVGSTESPPAQPAGSTDFLQDIPAAAGMLLRCHQGTRNAQVRLECQQSHPSGRCRGPLDPFAVGAARSDRPDGNEVWLRHGAMRSLHRASEWQRRQILFGARFGGRSAGHRHDRRTIRGRLASTATRLGALRRAAMRLLPSGPDHAGGCPSEAQSHAVRRADSSGNGGQSVPLRNISAHSPGIAAVARGA